VVLAFLCALSMITYLDRVCIASAATPLIGALGLQSEADLKWAFTAFTLAYAIFEIPSGWLGDRIGARAVLVRIVLWWSLFTALTGFAGLRVGGVFFGLGALIVVRLLFGIGEAGAYPNITRALHDWFPSRERGFGQGMVWMAGRLSGGLTPLVWTLLVEGVGSPGGGEAISHPLISWRSAFWLFAALGVIWASAFAAWFRNRPEEKASVGQAELELIRRDRSHSHEGEVRVPWRALFTDLNLWALCFMYFCGAFGWYFDITYLPKFLETQYRIDPGSLPGAVAKGAPLWLGAAGCLAGGLLTDWLTRRLGRKWGRRSLGLVGHSLCALCCFGCVWARDAVAFSLAIALAAFWNDLTMASSWAICQDIGRRYTGTVSGCMNTIGNLGGAAANLVTGTILGWRLSAYAVSHGISVEQMSAAEKPVALLPGYQVSFAVFGVVYLIAVLLWLRIDATRPVAQA
jgi:MFS family permease